MNLKTHTLPPGPRFYLATLGCKVNQYESQALREAWLAQGWQEAQQPDAADVCCINSCAVTARAVADLRALARRLKRAAPKARLVVTGCAAEALHDSLAALEEIDLLLPQSRKGELLRGPLPEIVTLKADSAFPPFSLSGSARSRAALKIQDGCSHGCAYCIVPLARGRARSRPFAESLAEARRLLDAGFREIVLSGVNLRQYKEADNGDFWDFLARLNTALAPQWQGKARLRLSSLEPGQLHKKALDTLAVCGLVAPHLHISLQSGSPTVLARMGRGHYDPAGLLPFLEKLTRIWPRFGLGADLLCAFPGESEEEFAQSLALAVRLPLTYAHVFPYSRRPGTRAAHMPGQIAADERKRRAAQMRALIDDKKTAFLRAQLDCRTMRAVFEERGGRGAARGLNEYYSDCRLVDGGQRPESRRLCPVRPVGLKDGLLLVEVVDEATP